MSPVRLALLWLAFSGVLQTARATTYLVTPDGTGDFPTIQAAVDSSADGDLILLAPGGFLGEGNANVDFRGKAITLRSEAHDRLSSTLFGGDGPDCGGVKFQSGEGPGSVLEDLSVSYTKGTCGAIYCNGTSPTIRNVLVEYCESGVIIAAGASPRLEGVQVQRCSPPGVQVGGAFPTLQGCVIEANTWFGSGGSGFVGGILATSSTVTLDSCVVRGNVLGGIVLFGSTLNADRCQILHNTGSYEGGAVYVSTGSSASFDRSTISRNEGSAGGFYVEGQLELTRSIVWGNCGWWADEIWGSFAGDCCDIRLDGIDTFGTPDTTNVVDIDPLFCGPGECGWYDPGRWSYAVDDQSPLWHMPCGQIGAEAQDCRVSVEPTSWGRVKALFR